MARLRWIFLLLNTGMIVGTIVIGVYYLADIIAGLRRRSVDQMGELDGDGRGFWIGRIRRAYDGGTDALSSLVSAI